MAKKLSKYKQECEIESFSWQLGEIFTLNTEGGTRRSIELEVCGYLKSLENTVNFDDLAAACKFRIENDDGWTKQDIKIVKKCFEQFGIKIAIKLK